MENMDLKNGDVYTVIDNKLELATMNNFPLVKEGLWLFRKINNGHHWSWLDVGETPTANAKALLAPYKRDFVLQVNEYFESAMKENKRFNSNKIYDIFVNILSKVDKEKSNS